MARQSSIPPEVLAYVPGKCCRIKNDRDIYRVYRYHAIKLPSGKWSSTYGDLIGKIIPGEGFIPNKRYEQELEKNKQGQETAQQGNAEEAGVPEGITDLEYGQYALLIGVSKNVYRRLQCQFDPETAAQVYCCGLICCVTQDTRPSWVGRHFNFSILTLLFPGVRSRMEEAPLRELLQRLGTRECSALGGPEEKELRQLYYENCGSEVIRDTADEIWSELEKRVMPLKTEGITAADIFHTAGMLRMVLENGTWQLRNGIEMYLQQLQKVGFVPQQTISASIDLESLWL